MQLKAIIKNISKSNNISAQIIMQNYMLERILERISLSPYKSNFILKGGYLIAAMVGLDTRATMAMDITIQGLPVNRETITKMFEKICHISVNDDVTFSIKHTEEIRESADYIGLRITLEALYPPMAVPLKIDITTGDKITPGKINYELKLLLEPRSIRVFAYNLETIIAEKLETVITRGDLNTRPRDYYDIYIIHQLQWQNIKPDSLSDALKATAQNRGTLSIIDRYVEILLTIEKSDIMNKYWLDYQTQFDYVKDIRFEDICSTIKDILDDIFRTDL